MADHESFQICLSAQIHTHDRHDITETDLRPALLEGDGAQASQVCLGVGLR